MTAHDGNGWTRCDRGHRHWGRYGAAGLLLAAVDGSGGPVVLLQQRSRWLSYGGAWAPPGGARDSHESAARAALREAAEECALDPTAVVVHGVLRDDHGGWAYSTVLASAAAPLAVAAISDETARARWIPAQDIARMPLHPGFAEQWPVLQAALPMALGPLTIIVDAANVIGSRPDGWWRDRAGAARRLVGQIEALAQAGLASCDLAEVPVADGLAGLDWWFPRFVVVLEGAAAAAAEPAPQVPRLTLVRAAGSGDDEIARQAAELPGVRLVVTADRELRARCEAVGASVVGPRWLLDRLPES
jgi:8-oxo-dGTP diphosphatase